MIKDLILMPYPKLVEYISTNSDYTSVPKVNYNASYKDEEYDIVVDGSGVKIECLGPLGEYRALTTLKQLKANKITGGIHIHDEPDFKNRGVMLDIRSKVPTLETLFQLVDVLSEVKINAFQLYIEGFPFAYKSYPIF